MTSRAFTVGGLREIAEVCSVHIQTVKGWRAKGYLAAFELAGTVSGAPAYDLNMVVEWFATDPPRTGVHRG